VIPGEVASENRKLDGRIYWSTFSCISSSMSLGSESIKQEATAKRNIAKEDIAEIANIQFEPDSQLFHARNYFILSFNLIGISFTDMVTIKPSDIVDGWLVYQRKKTHKIYNIKLTEKAQQLLNYYQQPERTYILPVIPESAVDNPEEERK